MTHHGSTSGFHIGLPTSTQVRFTVSQFTSLYNFAIVHVPWCDGEWHFVAALMCDEYIQLFVDDQQSEPVCVSHECGLQQQERFGRIRNTLALGSGRPDRILRNGAIANVCIMD
jgi:hypothetical protein